MAGFPNLPGVQVTLNDLGLAIAPPPAGPKITLLGVTANNQIPLREVLTISNIGQATSALWAGNSGQTQRYPGELAIAVEEAARAGAQNIEIVVIGHQSGNAYKDYISPVGNGQNSRHADLVSAYNAIKNLELDVVVPVGAWIDATGVDFGSQLADFCFQATTESDNACNGVIPMMRIGEWAHAYAESDLGTGGGDLDAEVVSYTGQAEYTFQLPSRALVDEWVLYASQVDSPIVTRAELPTQYDNYLAGSEDVGGTYSPLNDENTATDVNSQYFTTWQATNIDGSLSFDQRNNRVDAGARLSVVAAPLHTFTTQLKALAKGVGSVLSKTVQATDGAAAYGGFMTTLPPQSSPTNKRINTLGPQRGLSPVQANRLAGRRLVTFHERSRGFVVSNAMTGAFNVSKFVRSDYVRLTTVRVIDAIVDLIRSIADKYIGEPNTAVNRNAMSNEIDKFLKNMRVVSAINGYSFTITATPEQQVLGEAEVNLTVVPPFEIIKVITNISLTKAI